MEVCGVNYFQISWVILFKLGICKHHEVYMCKTQNSWLAVQALQSHVPLNLDKICIMTLLVHEILWSELLTHFLADWIETLYM